MKGKIDSTMLQILTLNSTLINSQCVLCPLSCYIEVFNKPDKFITVGGKGVQCQVLICLLSLKGTIQSCWCNFSKWYKPINGSTNCLHDRYHRGVNVIGLVGVVKSVWVWLKGKKNNSIKATWRWQKNSFEVAYWVFTGSWLIVFSCFGNE